MLILYLMFDTSHMQPQQSVPYSSQSLTFGIKSVHCQSYDSVCINKQFPMNGVIRTLSSKWRACTQCELRLCRLVVLRWPAGLFSPLSDRSTRCNNAAWNVRYL